jgi:hypothetical protein
MGFIGQDTIVFIRKKGSHYHLSNCWMVKDPSMIDDPYFGIEFKDVDKRQYRPDACASDKRK